VQASQSEPNSDPSSAQQKQPKHASTEAVSQYLLLQRKAELYFAFQHVYRYTEDPFTSLTPEALFQVTSRLSIAFMVSL